MVQSRVRGEGATLFVRACTFAARCRRGRVPVHDHRSTIFSPLRMSPTATSMSPVNVEIRPARRAEVPAIVRLLADDPLGARREQPGEPLAQAYWAAFDAMVAQGGNELIVAVRDGEVLGCVQLTIIPGLSRAGMTRGQLEGVRVHSAARGQGIGEALVRAAVARARAAGCQLVQLTSDRTREDALRFYERLGFTASHVGFKLALD